MRLEDNDEAFWEIEEVVEGCGINKKTIDVSNEAQTTGKV
jgi:hypothetical protein